MGSYNYQVMGWPAQPRSKKRREANIAAGSGAFSPGGGAGADVDLSGYIRIADLIKTTSDASVSEFLDTNAMSSLMVKTLLDQKANTIHDHNSQLIRPAVLVVPQIDPSDAGFSLASGEVAEFISHDGSFAEPSGSVTPADLKDLTLKINGVTQTTYNPASAAQFNVDLTNYALKSWVEAKDYLQGITKAMVENVLTGNITSHTHSQYLTSHQSLAGYATEVWVQQQGYLTSHQSLADYALKSEIPTSMAWSAITGRPTKLSQFTNDIISSWALAASKPSYSWSEITSRPTALSAFSEDSTHRLVTDVQIANWNSAYGWGNHADAGYLTSFTETDPTVPAWAKAASKPSYTFSEIGSKPTTLSGYGITDAKIETPSGTSNRKITLGSNNFTIYSWALASAKPSYTFSEIGSKPTTIDGYGITSVPEAYLTWGGKNYSASYGPIDAAMVGDLGANRFAFGSVSAIEIYYSRNNGVTWIDYESSDAGKKKLVSGLSASYAIGKAASNDVANANYQLRIRIGTGIGLYTVLNKFIIFVGTNGTTGNWCTIRKRLKTDQTAGNEVWTNVVTQVGIGGWSGWNVINTAGITFGNGSGQYGQIEFTFGCTGYNGNGTTNAGLTVYKLLAFGGMGWTTPSNLARFNHLYDYDENQNMWMPAGILPKADNVSSHTLGSSSKRWSAVYATNLYGNLAWTNIQNKPTTLSGYGITDGYSSLTTSGSGNAITAVSGTGHSLTFTKGNTFVDLANEQTISGRKHISYLDVTGALAIPQVEPTSESGKVFEFIDHSGSFGESSGSVTPADLKDLTLKINGVTQVTYNPASAAQFNVDLTNYALKSWVEAKNYLQGITKTMVENVLTGNITSHTHSQYLTSHQSLSGYATEVWVQQQGYLTSHQSLSNYYTKAQADAKFLTEHQSLADYALKSEIPTSMAWSAITGRPTKLSQFTNDIISSWALAASKPSYSWSEITSRPTALSAFSEDTTHRLVTDSQITAWSRAYGELIMGTQTTATGSWTGVSSLATSSDMTSGYRFTYWLPYAGSGNATLTLTFADNTTKTINLYVRGTSRLTTHFPAGTKIDFVYLESVSIAGSTTKYTGAWPEAYYDTTYSAGTKALFDAGTNTSNRVWSASVLASAVAAKEHSHLWADITDCPSKLSDFTNDLISSWALAASKPSYSWSEIGSHPTKLSQFTNDILSDWALATTKPSYSWTEITSRPTTLASFSGDSTHRLVSDTQISNWNSAYGWGNHADAGYLTSFTESDPTVPAWAKTASKPSYTLDEVTDGSTRKLSNYVPTTRTINSKALSGNITLTLDDIANGTNRSLANYLPLSGGTLTGNLIFNTSSAKGLYSNNGTLNQRVLLMSSNGDLSIGDGLPANSKSLYLDGYQTYLRFGTSKNYSMTLWSDGTIRSSTGANQLSLGYRSGNTIYPFKNVYSTFNVSTKCAGTIGGTMLYGVARFSIQNTKKARTFAIKIPSSMGAYVTFKIVLYSPFNLSPSSTITVSAGAFNLTAGAYCALYPSCSIEGSFAGRVAFARDGNTSSANMYVLLGSCNDTNALYQGGMIAIDSIIHADSITNADTIMNFGYELLDLDSESMFTKITECVNADAHFRSVTVTEHVTAPKIDCTNMFLVPTSEPPSVPAGKVAEYIDLTGGSFAN